MGHWYVLTVARVGACSQRPSFTHNILILILLNVIAFIYIWRSRRNNPGAVLSSLFCCLRGNLAEPSGTIGQCSWDRRAICLHIFTVDILNRMRSRVASNPTCGWKWRPAAVTIGGVAYLPAWWGGVSYEVDSLLRSALYWCSTYRSVKQWWCRLSVHRPGGKLCYS